MVFEGGLRAQKGYKKSLSDIPLISVITVVFNAADTLKDTIESVRSQTYQNVEHIVIDGGSTDGTIDILRQYDQVVDYWLSEKDAGIYDAMNKGIALCTGDYIGMLNADDMFADNSVLQNIIDEFNAKKVDAVFSCLNIVEKNNLSHVLRKYRVSNFSSFLLKIGVMPPHPTFYCKKSVYKDAGRYKTNYKITADFEMLVRLLIKQKITWSFINKVTVIMRSGGVSNRGIKSAVLLNSEIIRACKENNLYTNWLFLFLKLPIRVLEVLR